MNYMAEVARLLGVEIGEEFGIVGYEANFRVTDSGIKNDSRFDNEVMLSCLLNGVEEIKRKPQKPKCGEIYFIADPNAESLVASYTWNDGRMDSIWLERGLVFRTKEEAVEAAEKMLNALEV